MAAVVIRNLSEATHRALKRRAKEHGRSTEAEIRSILEEAVEDASRKGLGTKLAEIGRRYGGIELDVTRSKEPFEPPVLE
jgi:antitoxin FitA